MHRFIFSIFFFSMQAITGAFVYFFNFCCKTEPFKEIPVEIVRTLYTEDLVIFLLLSGSPTLALLAAPLDCTGCCSSPSPGETSEESQSSSTLRQAQSDKQSLQLLGGTLTNSLGV